MKVKEVIDKVNTYSYWSISMVEDEVFDNEAELVKCDLDIQRYRWFSVGTNVYKLEDGYIGITGLVDSFGDSSIEDYNYKSSAEEYIPCVELSYQPRGDINNKLVIEDEQGICKFNFRTLYELSSKELLSIQDKLKKALFSIAFHLNKLNNVN